MSGLQPRNHEIDLKTAAEITERHRMGVTVQGARAAEEGSLGGMFSKDAVIKLLSQPGAAHLRFYYGRNAKGGRELVLVAADAQGNDLGTVALDIHLPCPPICPPAFSALRG